MVCTAFFRGNKESLSRRQGMLGKITLMSADQNVLSVAQTEQSKYMHINVYIEELENSSAGKIHPLTGQ